MDQYYSKVASIKERWTDIKVAMQFIGLWGNKFKTALDIGCAEGEITRKIAQFTTKVIAFDSVKEKIDNCPKLSNVTFLVHNFLNFEITEFDYELIFYLGVHHKIININSRYDSLRKIYKTDAIIIQRTPLEYSQELLTVAFQTNRNILFYPGNKNQGCIAICQKNK